MNCSVNQLNKNATNVNDIIVFTQSTNVLIGQKSISTQINKCKRCGAVLTQIQKCSVCGTPHNSMVITLSDNGTAEVLLKNNNYGGSSPITIFCVDCSGTMEGERIESLRSMIMSQIEDMRRRMPNNRVCIISFDSGCIIFGDGTKDPLNVASYKSFDELVGIANQNSVILPVNDCYKQLCEAVNSLEPSGVTCGVSALLLSVQIGSHYGGRVIFCTDGLSNRGITAQESMKKITAIAQKGNVVVNVFSFSDCDSFLQPYSFIANSTNGIMKIINDKTIGRVVDVALKREMIGKDGVVKLFIPPFFKCQPQEKSFANVVGEYTISFQCVITDVKIINSMESIFVQSQFEYTNIRGNQVLVVCEKKLPITSIVESRNIKIVINSILQKTAELLLENQADQALNELAKFDSLEFDLPFDKIEEISQIVKLLRTEIKKSKSNTAINDELAQLINQMLLMRETDLVA